MGPWLATWHLVSHRLCHQRVAGSWEWPLTQPLEGQTRNRGTGGGRGGNERGRRLPGELDAGGIGGQPLRG